MFGIYLKLAQTLIERVHFYRRRGVTFMRMDKLTSKFQIALSDAQSLAIGRDHQFIEPVHLMLTLACQV